MTDRPLTEIAADLRRCAASWEPEARLLGNVEAREIVRLCEEMPRLWREVEGARDHLEAFQERTLQTVTDGIISERGRTRAIIRELQEKARADRDTLGEETLSYVIAALDLVSFRLG